MKTLTNLPNRLTFHGTEVGQPNAPIFISLQQKKVLDEGFLAEKMELEALLCKFFESPSSSEKKLYLFGIEII